MVAPPFGFQQQLDPNLLAQIVEAGKNSGWGPVIQQAISGATQGYQQGQQRREHNQQRDLVKKLAMQMQNYNQPQQGPQMPTGPAIQGPQGYAPPNQGPNSTAVPAGQYPMPQNPTSGMGAPNSGGASEILGTLIKMDPSGELVQKLIAQRMGLNQPDALQQSEIVKNQALAKRYSMGPQQKPTNPLDDAFKQVRIQALQKLMNRQSQPKPPNPVPAQALDLRAQIANNQQAPWYKKLGFAGGIKPVKVNPIKGQSIPSNDVSSMTDEQLMEIVNESDGQ